MTDSPNAKAYLSAWAGSLTHLLSQLGGAAWECGIADVAADELPIEAVLIRSNKLPGSQNVLLSASALTELLSLFLGEPTAVAQELDATQREALEELSRQWCGLAATALKPDFGEMSLEVTSAKRDAPSSADSIFLRVQGGSRISVIPIEVDAELQTFLSAAEPPQAVAPIAPHPASDSQIDELLRQGNLELLMDVELPVMLRFGCREATLREVLDMATGAVLELDREIQEPVDLVLNGKIIARGEVVVIDGDFGLRVIEVASPQQRVNSFTAA